MKKIVIYMLIGLASNSLYSMKHLKRISAYGLNIRAHLLQKYGPCLANHLHKSIIAMTFWNIERRGKKRNEEGCAVNFLHALDTRIVPKYEPAKFLFYGAHEYRKYGVTSLLDLAVRWSLKDVVKYLVTVQKVDPNARLQENKIALHNLGKSYADWSAFVSIINDHKTAGVDFSVQDENGNTLIHTAPTEIIHLLAQKGAPHDKPNKKFIANVMNDKDKKKEFMIVEFFDAQQYYSNLNASWDMAHFVFAGDQLPTIYDGLKRFAKLGREAIQLQEESMKEGIIWCTPLVEAIAKADILRVDALLRVAALKNKSNFYDELPIQWRDVSEAGKSVYQPQQRDLDCMVEFCLKLERDGRTEEFLKPREVK